MVEQDQMRRREGGDLARQLAADRAAGAGHQHPPAGDQLAHRGGIQHLARPAEQIFHRYRQQGAGPRLAGLGAMQLGQARQPGQRHALGFGDADQTAEIVAIEVVAGEHEALRGAAFARQPLDDAAGRIHAGQHRHAVNMAAEAPAAAGVENAEHGEGGAGRAAHFADEALGRIVGSHQQHRHGQRTLALHQLAEIAVAQQAIADARRAQQEDQHEPVYDEGGTRIALQTRGEEQDRQEQHDGDADGACDRQKIGQRGIAPDAAMQAGEEEHHGRDGDEEHESGMGGGLIERHVAHPQPERERKRNRRHRQVVEHGEREVLVEAGRLNHAGAPTIASALRGLNCARWRKGRAARSAGGGPARRRSAPHRPATRRARPSARPARTAPARHCRSEPP